MFFISSCVVILCAVSLGNGFGRVGRIADSNVVDIKDHSYQVNIEYKLLFRCTGIIVHPEWVLTPAQCLYGVDQTELRIRAGTAMRDILGVLHYAQEIRIHSEFNRETLDKDIALLKVTNPFDFTDGTVGLATLSDAIPKNGTTVAFTGWGALTSGTWFAMNLLKAEVPFIEHDDCMNRYEAIKNTVTENMICAGEDGNSACQGDTGDPLLYNNEVIGIMSWTFGCGEYGFPAVFTGLANFISWIDTIIA